MDVSENKTGGFYAFQRISGDSKKVGFISDAPSETKAIQGVVELVAVHCSSTAENPADIIDRVEIK